MGFLPKAIGTRPRLACEIRAEGVVAARAEDSSGALSAVERVAFANSASNGNGNGAGGASRSEKVAAVRQVLDAVSGRGREVTLVVPDQAARVLLVDFDELPGKAAEALPVVRFRLKKLLPFDADDAAVSYQVMSDTRAGTQVLAVAMPHEVLAEYESLVREAGYEPGAVLPSTLAALADLDADAGPSLVVNAGRESVTTAIVRAGVLLLHRTIFLATGLSGTGSPAAGDPGAVAAVTAVAPAVDVARQANMVAASAVESGDEIAHEASRDTTIAAIAARFAAMEGQTTPAPRAPEAPQVSRVSSALVSGMTVQGTTVPAENGMAARGSTSSAEEIVQAVNVAAAYFEDTLEMEPQSIVSAGTLGAEALARLLGGRWQRVEEMVSGGTSDVPAGWLAGVRGALRS